MDANTVPIGRVGLPENWEPEGVICVCVPCPDDPQFVSMVIGMVDNLRWSSLYARDETHNGAAIVSRVWDAALRSRPISVVECGADMYFDVRINPSNPCQMQASTDGGETWHLALDLSCSGGTGNPPPPESGDTDAGQFAGLYITQFIMNLLIMLEETSIYNDFRDTFVLFMGPTGLPEQTLQAMASAIWAKKPVTMPIDIGDQCEFECIYQQMKQWQFDNWLEYQVNFAANWASFQVCTALGALEKVLHETAAWMGANVLNQLLLNKGADAGLVNFGSGCALEERCDDFRLSPDHWSVMDYGEYIGPVYGYFGTLNENTGRYEVHIHSSITPFGSVGQIRLNWGNAGTSQDYKMWVNGELLLDGSGGSAGARTDIVPVGGVVNAVEVKITQNTINTGPWITEICFEDA